jgi:hypothetical protein
VLQQRPILWFGAESTYYNILGLQWQLESGYQFQLCQCHLNAFSNRIASMTADALMSKALLKYNMKHTNVSIADIKTNLRSVGT